MLSSRTPAFASSPYLGTSRMTASGAFRSAEQTAAFQALRLEAAIPLTAPFRSASILAVTTARRNSRKPTFEQVVGGEAAPTSRFLTLREAPSLLKLRA